MTLKTTPAERERIREDAEDAYTLSDHLHPPTWTRFVRDFTTLEATLASAVATLEHYRHIGDDSLTGPTRAATWLDAYYQKG